MSVPFFGGPLDGQVHAVDAPPALSVCAIEPLEIDLAELWASPHPEMVMEPTIRQVVYRLHRMASGRFCYLAPEVTPGGPGHNSVVHYDGHQVTAHGGGGSGGSTADGDCVAYGGNGAYTPPGGLRPRGRLAPGEDGLSGDACRSYGAGPLIL